MEESRGKIELQIEESYQRFEIQNIHLFPLHVSIVQANIEPYYST